MSQTSAGDKLCIVLYPGRAPTCISTNGELDSLDAARRQRSAGYVVFVSPADAVTMLAEAGSQDAEEEVERLCQSEK